MILNILIGFGVPPGSSQTGTVVIFHVFVVATELLEELDDWLLWDEDREEELLLEALEDADDDVPPQVESLHTPQYPAASICSHPLAEIDSPGAKVVVLPE